MAETRIDQLRRRVQTDPASIAFAALAEEYRRGGHFEDAIATCATGLLRHPSYVSAHVTLGRAYVAINRIDEGRAVFERVLRLAPENLTAIRGLAEIHSLGRTESEDVGGGSASPDRRPDAAECARLSTESSLALALSIPHHSETAPLALTGLEDFLGAISRARGASAVPVSLGAR